MSDKLSFIASLPPIQSAINLDGRGDGARIKLDVPRSDVMEIMKLQRLAEMTLRVMVEVEE